MMAPSSWHRRLDRLVQRRGGRPLFLFSDFDGTLVAIRRDPAKVTLSAHTRRVFDMIVRQIPVAIISGRSLAYLQKAIPYPVTLAGNHGLEIKMEGVPLFRHPEAIACRTLIRQLARTLGSAVQGTGALIEAKELTLTFHYRTVLPARVESVCKRFHDIFDRFPNLGRLRIHTGKMCLEVRPNIHWGKEEAMIWILEAYQKKHPERPLCPIYMGDDETDKGALARAHQMGIALFKGKRTPSVTATDFIASHEALLRLLKALVIAEGASR